MSSAPLFVTAAPGTTDLLAGELGALGLAEVREAPGGATGMATLEQAYRVCLWSRIGLHVLWPIGGGAAADAAALYAAVRALDWAQHLDVAASLAVDFSGRLPGISHTQFGAQRVKDAIVDQFRERSGQRPSVDRLDPALRLNVRAARGALVIAVDLAGASLHRRGYRGGQGVAPLKENLAAALLLRSGWPALAAAGAGLVDPLCGSGTLPIEAALIAADIAPGLLRADCGSPGWRGHDAVAWRRLRAEAEARRAPGRLEPGRIRGYDRDPRVLREARANAARAGLGEQVAFECRELADLPPAPVAHGLVAVNPPYGARLGDGDELAALYALLGEQLRRGYRGWEAAVLAGEPALGRALGLRARRTHRMMNGPLECRLLRCTLAPESFVAPREPGRPPPIDAAAALARPGAAMFANRLRKNLAELSRWARREAIACYRLYDADMPEYAFAIDLYQADPEGRGGRWLYVQEYAAPASVDRARARARREEALAVLPEVTGLPAAAIYWRTRRPQRGAAQYQRLAQRGERVAVAEGDLRLLVNFTDYLDTGLFLDHRLTRARLRALAAGQRFLNLFCYTGSATVAAAAGGAQATTSVDLSATYLDWARRNLELNGYRGSAHQLLRADCLEWLAAGAGDRYGLIFVDPPTFSNSKRMQREFDLQRDHVPLLRAALARLAPGGVLLFSTNYRRFRLDAAALAGLAITDLSAATLPRDFARNPRIHQCFELRFDGPAPAPVASPPP